MERLAEISVSRQALCDEDLDGLRELAAVAAEHGIALRSLVAEYLTLSRRAWADSPGARRAQNVVDLREVTSALLRAVGDATVALTEGYETAHRAAIRREEASRREFVDDLLEGRTDLGRLAERAERFGLRLVGPHGVTVARAGSPFGAGDRATRYIEEALTARFGVREVLITTKDGLLVCVSPGAASQVPHHFATQVRNAVSKDYQVAISRPRLGPSGIVRSYQEARSTLDLAARLGLDNPVVCASDLLVFQVLGRDRAAITDLVDTVLGALEHTRRGPQPLLDTLTTYFDSGCLNTTTARRLGLSVRAVTYRLARIRQLTGYDPADPDQRYTLQTATLGARLLGWPSRPLQRAD
ncbi:carbohydrate diacid transcriptional activator CdaR [Streptomyces jeddahensis]|uniref:Carbohydrate diacid transcriptional activator CdaR n=1 Tax=Streptomyces jeddahensis TaxID=1716141 RepID=A0A177HFY2_9ACTN|nr:carbohydrate diacid transcriptional activator CdaR [Streptomyces jeddahensis]